MQLAMVDSTDWNGELVAHASSECARLGKREVMWIGWDAAAHKAGLSEHEPAVLLIAQSNRFAQSTHCAAAIPFLDLAHAALGPLSSNHLTARRILLTTCHSCKLLARDINAWFRTCRGRAISFLGPLWSP